jgi:hypothetical protein
MQNASPVSYLDPGRVDLKCLYYNTQPKLIGVNAFRFLHFSCVQNGRLVTGAVPEVSFSNPSTDIHRNYPTTRWLAEIQCPAFYLRLHRRVEHEELLKKNIKRRPNVVSPFQLCFN